MIQLSTLEIAEDGEVISVSSPESSSQYDLFPTVGGNIIKHWDERTNLEMEGYLKMMFSTGNSIEFSITLDNRSFQCTAYSHLPSRAFLHLKLTRILSTKKTKPVLEGGKKKIKGHLIDDVLMEATTPIHFVDLEGNIVAFNNAATDLFGYHKFEYNRLTVYDLIPKYSKEIWRQKCVDYALSGSQTFEEVIKKKDGSRTVVQINTNMVRYGDSEVVYCCFTDLTQRRKEDSKLKLVDFTFRNAATAILLVKEDGEIYDFNEAALAMFGYEREEFRELKVFNIDPNATPEVRKVLWDDLKAAGSTLLQRPLKRKDGTWMDLEVKATIVEYEGVELNCAFLTDITEKLKAEEQLQLVNHAFKNAAVPMYFVNSNAKVHDYNKSICEVLGYNEEEFKNLSVFDTATRHTPATWATRMEELKSGKTVAHVTKLRKKDGTLIDVEMRSNLFEYGNNSFAFTSFIDITEKIKIEKKLKFVDFSFKNAYIPIYLVRKDATLYDFNDAAHTLLGYSREEMSKMRIHELDPNYSPEVWKERWATFNANETTKTILTQHRKKDGTLIDVEVQAKLMIFNGHEYHCSFVTDITEKKKTMERLELVDFTFWQSSMPMILGLEDGSFLDFNQAALDLYGYTKEEMALLKVNDLRFAKSKSYEQLWKEVNAFKKMEWENIHKKKDGTLMNVQIMANLLERGDRRVSCTFITDISDRKRTEDRLKLVDFAFRKTAVSIFITRSDATLYDFNDAVLDLYGYSREEMVLLKVDDLTAAYAKEEVSKAWAELWRRLKEQKSIVFTSKHLRKDGSVFDVEIRVNYLEYGGEELNCAFITDITDRKSVEDRLRLVDFGFKNVSTAILLVDNVGNIYDYNEASLELFGYTNREFRNLKIRDIDVLQTFEEREAFRNKLREEKKLTLNKKVKRKDGSWIYVEMRANHLLFDNNEMNCAFITDITEKKKNEDALRKSITRFEHATLATSDVIWEMDLENNTLFLSNNFTVVFGHGISGLEPIDDNIWLRNVHPDDLQRVLREEDDTINNSRERWEMEYRFKKVDGIYAAVLDRCFAMKDENGKVIKLIGAMRDVTKEKEEENERILLLTELVENNKELLQFSYITTHNLRAPLTNLISICNRVDIKFIEDFQTKRLIEGFKQSTMLLNDTLNDLIKILIIKENRHLETDELLFGDVLEKVKSSISTILLKNVVKVEADFSEALTVQFSSVYLESIFLNLLTNSIKYAHPTRYPLIKIKTTREKDGTAKLLFSDNGIGMNMERVKNKIFGLYQRFHNNADAKGIGLYLVHSQVTALGGKIEVESEVGVGTTFIIMFK